MKKHSFCKLRSATAFSLLLALAPFLFSVSALASETPAPESEQAWAEALAENSEASATPVITTVPENTAEPEAATLPEASDEPEITPEPENTAAPEVTASPEASDEPETTPEPETSDEPEATPEPEATDEPEATPEPEATDEPEITPEPEASDESETTPEPEPVPTLLDLLNIDWGAPNFVYSRKWMPREMVYQSHWTAEDDCVATINNPCGDTLSVEIVFVSQLSDVSGTILRDVTLEDGTVEAQPLADGILTLAPGETATVRLALTGDPSPDELGGSIGSVQLNAVSAVG